MTPAQVVKAAELLRYCEDLKKDLEKYDKFRFDRQVDDSEKVGRVIVREYHMSARIPEGAIRDLLQSEFDMAWSELNKMGVKA